MTLYILALSRKYSNQSQNASVKNIITFNGLLNTDQYSPVDHSFYSYSLEDQNQDNSTIINWVAVTPLGNKNVMMFNFYFSDKPRQIFMWCDRRGGQGFWCYHI